MVEIINKIIIVASSWLKLLIKLLLLHLVGCLHYCFSDARSHKHETEMSFWQKHLYILLYILISISPDDDSVMSKNVALNTRERVVLTVLTLVIIRKHNGMSKRKI